MDYTFMKLQHMVNEAHNSQFELFNKRIEILVKIIEDHEEDMVKMANKINELEKRISKIEL